MDRNTLNLTELTDAILLQMSESGFMESTKGFYITLFRRLCRMAEERGDEYYTADLGQAFINDQSHVIPENTERYHHERTVAYKRCIKLVESFLATGIVDWTPSLHCASFPISSADFRSCFQRFLSEMAARELKTNTIDGYRRFVYYFIEYLEGKGYRSLSELKHGDIVAFISVICSERYQATSLGAHMPGLKLFLSLFHETEQYLPEIPEHLPKKRDILQVYSDDEYKRIISHLEEADDISLRNKAIIILAMNTGLRAVDICGMKLRDIDWEHDMIHIMQQKTGKAQEHPVDGEHRKRTRRLPAKRTSCIRTGHCIPQVSGSLRPINEPCRNPEHPVPCSQRFGHRAEGEDIWYPYHKAQHGIAYAPQRYPAAGHFRGTWP